jgi:catechol 2,3-dioxygenase-like lactoylglutathione lyase family enzyme
MPVDHLGFNVTDYARSKAFYAAALEPLGFKVVMEIPPDQAKGSPGGGLGDNGAPVIWLQQGTPVGNKFHVAFTAPNRGAVDAFHAAATRAGGKDNGGPGLRPNYHPNYYGAFVLDPDGHNIEVVCHKPA